MKPRILIIITRPFDPNAGGVQRSTYKISSYFKNTGHETHIFSFQKTGHKQQEVAQLHTGIAASGIKNKANHQHLKDIIVKIQPDIVINQMPYERQIGITLDAIKKDIPFLLLSCLRNTLFVVKLNIESYINSAFPKLIQPLFKNSLGKRLALISHKMKHKSDLKFILDTYDRFILFGPPNLEELKYFVGDYKLDKTHFIPNSILSVQDNIPCKENRILWLSRVTYNQKRADLILPLWKKIMHKLPEWEFDIVGEGDAFNDIKKQIETENIPRIKMYGKQTPYEYYSKSPIYIMTSAFEGFPNTLIEAQSYGCIPIVYNTYPICSWILKDGKNGILIPPYNIEKMAEGVISLANDKSRQNSLMSASLENAREFHLEKVGKKWLTFFDNELQS